MNTQEKTLELLFNCKNLNKWLFRVVSPYTGNRVLEIGCGTGNLTALFEDKELIMGIDIEKKWIDIAKKRLNKSNFKLACYDVTDEKITNLKKHKIDTVMCFNVLEHIKEEKKALNNMAAIIQPNGKLIVLVPAFKWLIGSLDKEINHIRRYSKKSLTKSLESSGFIVEKVFYMNFLGVFGWGMNSLILKKKILPEKQLKFYDAISPFASSFERIIGPPIGLSLIVVAKKGS